MFIVLTSGKLKEALGSWIVTRSVFCHSFSFSDSPRIIHKCLAAQCPNSNWKVLFHHTDGIDQKHALNVPKVYGSTFQKANLSDHFCFKCWWPLYQTKVSFIFTFSSLFSILSYNSCHFLRNSRFGKGHTKEIIIMQNTISKKFEIILELFWNLTIWGYHLQMLTQLEHKV